MDLPIENGGSFHSHVSLPKSIPIADWLKKRTIPLLVGGDWNTIL